MTEDADWWVGVQKAGATLALAAGLLIGATQTLAAQQVFGQVQDDPGNLVFVEAVQEDYWQNNVPPVNWPQPALLTDTDQHPVFVSAFEADEDFWNNAVAPLWGQNYLVLPLVIPEDFPAFPNANPVLDDGGLWQPQIPAADLDWNVLFFLDDGSWVPAMQPDEDFLPTSALPAPYNWPWASQAFQSSDEDQLVRQFVAAEDPIWLQLVRPVEASLIWPRPWVFEQNEEGNNLRAFTDELFWEWLVPAVPRVLTGPTQWSFDQQEPAGNLFLDLDEGLQGPLPSPVPDANRLLQQWPFEQNEPSGSFSTIHEEDLWINAVSPVIWMPAYLFSSVTAYDEVIGTTPSTGQDEDFWNYFVTPWVAPVPDAMLLRFPYLPDPEEIPAGSLVPFVPPPPPFCPLPPCGPDADTCISIFQNKGGGPVLALFCRTCMSGLPLVVRGDYAIWCQTCCSFVSKDTTYMGTVRAPGQFRGRF